MGEVVTPPTHTGTSTPTTSGSTKISSMYILDDSKRNTEKWIWAFSNEIGVQLTKMDLLESANEIIENRSDISCSLVQLIEFSFYATDYPSPKALRYVIDVHSIENRDVEKMIRVGTNLLGSTFEGAKQNQPYRKLDLILNKTGECLPNWIGIEHTSNGSLSSLKTYWRFPSPFEELRLLVSGDEKEMLERVLGAAQAFWPGWKDAKLIGIDYKVTGENRFKVYLPQRNFAEPLCIVTFYAFLLQLGWKVDLDTLLKFSCILLGCRPEVIPTAYSVALKIGSQPSVGIEIATKAYFSDSKQALSAVNALAESLGLDPSPIGTSVTALEMHNPLARPPVVEVISLDFYMDGGKRITSYCRL